MRLQDFPYNFDRGMQHHNIWCTRPLSDEEIAEVCGISRSAPLAIFMVTQEASDMYLPVAGHHAASCRLGGGLAYCVRCDADITRFDFEVSRRSAAFA